jgi:hypothetical protein
MGFEYPLPDMERSTQATFHGGGMLDEVAALVALALGVRMEAGGDCSASEKVLWHEHYAVFGTTSAKEE